MQQTSKMKFDSHYLYKATKRFPNNTWWEALHKEIIRQRTRAWTSMIVVTVSGLMILALLAGHL
jgi:hypothetical protein